MPNDDMAAGQAGPLAELIDADIAAFERITPPHLAASGSGSHEMKNWICDGRMTGAFLDSRITDYLRRRKAFAWTRTQGPTGKGTA